MKKRILLLVVVGLLTSLSISAGTWTEPSQEFQKTSTIVTDFEYYLYNVDSDTWLAAGNNSWVAAVGYRAGDTNLSAEGMEHGFKFKFTDKQENGSYRIYLYYGPSGKLSSLNGKWFYLYDRNDGVFLTNNNTGDTYWTFEFAKDGTFQFKSNKAQYGDNYVGLVTQDGITPYFTEDSGNESPSGESDKTGGATMTNKNPVCQTWQLYAYGDPAALVEWDVYQTLTARLQTINEESEAVTGESFPVSPYMSQIGDQVGTLEHAEELASLLATVNSDYQEWLYNKIGNTKETAKTVAEAKMLINALDAETLAHPNNLFYVKGKIAQIDSYVETDKAITYWISDDGTTTGAMRCLNGKGLNGADFASAEDITVGIPVTVVGNLKKSDDIYGFDANNQLVTYEDHQDITITAADITDGDISAAYAAKKAAIGEASVGAVSITLDGATAYTVSATIEATGNITIAGNGATIDASALEANMFAMSGAPTEWTAADVNISGLTIKGLKKALFYSACQKYVANNFVIDNCVVELAADATTIDYTKGGTALNLTVTNSTFYAPTKTIKSFYSSQGGQEATKYASDAIQTFTFKNNTMYNLAPGKKFFSHRSSNQKWLTYDVENNIFVDCGKSGQVIKGMNGGASGTNPTWIIKGNLFNYGGADTSASESTGDSEEPIQDSVAGIITFTDAAAGDLNGSVVLAPTATQPEALGDARWILVYATGLAINIATDIENGTIAVDKTYGAEGTEITLTATPADGYEFGAYSVKDADDTEVEVTKDEETGKYSFVMPATAVTVSATFNELPHTVEMAEGTDDAGNWTIEPTSATSGTEIKATYKGTRKVKSVKAVKK